MKVKVIIIDDEAKAISIIKSKIERHFPELAIIATNPDPEEGLEQIKNMNPDLVFLDIAMPILSGFDVLDKIEKPNFEVVFITAFDEYAVQAINRCAIGYLLKPINTENFIKTVENAIIRIQHKTATERNTTLIENLKNVDYENNKVAIPTTQGLEFVLIKNIIRCEGYEGYTKIFFKNRTQIISSYNLGYYKNLLNSDDFFLIHKSHLVNLNYIEKYINEGFVKINGDSRIPVSRSKKSLLIEILKLR